MTIKSTIKRTVRGIRDNIPPGYILGRSSSGDGAVELISLRELGAKLVANSAVSGGSGGGVTSVGLTLDSGLYTVGGSPVTGSGTLAGTLNTQTMNTVLAGPTTGAAAKPTFRALVLADLPALSYTNISGLATVAHTGAYSDLTGTPSVPVGANPTATASDVAVNGAAATWMRSDAAPAVQKGSNSVFGIVKVDGTSILATGGVLSVLSSAVTSAVDSDLNQMFFGDGSDGDLTISSGRTVITRDMYYNNVTISGSGSLNVSSCRVFIKGTLDVSAAGADAIVNMQVAGSSSLTLNGANSLTTVGGARGNVGNPISVATSNNTPGAGANGGTGVGAQAAAAGTSSHAGLQGASGKGGAGGAVGATSGGASRAGIANVVATLDIANLTAQMWSVVSTVITFVYGGVSSPGGSAGAGDGVGSGGGGGGGGSGGNVIWLSANTINRSGSTAAECINANGGNGGNGGPGAAGTNTGGGGGGGGGSGGWLYVVYRSLTGSAATSLFSARGGNGGNGGTARGTGTGGTGGDAGSRGRICLYCLNDGTQTRSAEDATTVAGSGPTGATGGGGATANSQALTL